MKIDIIGLSLQINTLKPLLIVQEKRTKEQYNIPLALDDATQLAHILKAKENNTLSQYIKVQHKNIERLEIIPSQNGGILTKIHILSWFCKKSVDYPLSIGIGVSLLRNIELHASQAFIQHLEKTKLIELQRAVDTVLSSLETSLLYEQITSQKNLLGMMPETTLIM